MKRTLVPILGAGLIAVGLGGPAAAEMERGEILALSCMGCHGTEGKSPGSMPALNGKSEGYIAEAMLAFRNDDRPATVMNRLAKGYSEDEIEALAAYLASLD